MSDRSHTPKLESILGAVGALVVSSVLAFLAFQAVVADDQGPELSATVLETETSNDQHVVHYEVRNDGSRTAEQVHVMGLIVERGQTLTQVSSTIPYVPAGSSRRGVLVFDQAPPTSAKLRVRAVSYTTP